MQAKAVPILNLNEFEIVTLKTGIKSLRSIERGEIFHPGIGPKVEAHQLHVDQQRVVERSEALFQSGQKFVIWDVGLGAAANVLVAIEALKNTRSQIEIHSFDRTTAPAEFAMIHAEELGYVDPYKEILSQLLTEGEVKVTDQIQWKFHLGDFSRQLKTEKFPSPSTIFYDPYSATGNPEMWTLEHFQQLYLQTDPSVPCLLTNYTCSTAVRVALILAGFSVGRGCAVHTKRETTIASNHLALLDDPFDKNWLERVQKSTNAAPLRGSVYSTTRISDVDFEILRKSPQFQIE
jgi:queuine tRNA-ribosyltransferase